VNIGGESIDSTEVSATTLARIPSNGSFNIITNTSIVASWGSNGNPIGTYYCLAIFNNDDNLLFQNPWTNNLTDTLTELTPNTSYEVKVRAKNCDGIVTDWYIIGNVYTLILLLHYNGIQFRMQQTMK
jgi:hypothetical protein